MKDVFSNQILPPILTAIGLGLTGVLVVVIKSVGDVAIQYIQSKKQVVEQTLQLDKHKEEIETEKAIWNIVEEKYRITDNISNLVSSKAALFDKMLLEKFPYLTAKEIADIRQALAGEFNKGKALLNEDNIKQQAKELLDKNNELESENIELKNKLDAISNYVPKGQEQGQ